MLCVKCNTTNQPGSQFCSCCGAPLEGEKSSIARSPREWLGVFTAQLVLALLGLYVMKAILAGLPFLKDMDIPDFSLSPAAILKILVGLIVVGLLIKFILNFHHTWPQAYPGYIGLGKLIIDVLTLILLSSIYLAIKPLFPLFMDDTPELLLIIQIVLLLVALFFASRAVIRAYLNLPAWLLKLRDSYSITCIEPKNEQ